MKLVLQNSVINFFNENKKITNLENLELWYYILTNFITTLKLAECQQ